MSSSNQDPSWDDPRLTVFIIWGVFIFVVFFCIPSKRIVQRICRRIAIRCCGYEEESSRVADNGNGSGRDVLWDLLSPARKLEIDSLRASHLSYRLHPFSLTLEEKHMLTESPLASTSSSPITTSTTLTTTTKPTFSKDKDDDGKLLPPSDATNDIDMRTSDGIDVVSLEREVARTSNAKRESSISSTIDDSSEIGSSGHDMGPPDAEKGLGNFGKAEEEKEIDASVPYTHILIPPPGHNYDGMDIMSVPACADKDENETNTSSNPKGGNSFRLRLFGGKTKAVIANDSVKDVDNGGGDNSVRNSLSTIVLPKEKGQSKVCSNVCTICLMEYEPSERVSWSSNKECTHVFHEDCIIHWLVSLGRTKSKMTRFSEEPTEAQLLNYELECPCCRQEFVVSNNSMEWGGGGGSREDENV